MLEGMDSVEVAPAKQEGDNESNYAAEEQLWRHEFFRDCMAPKQASFKVSILVCSLGQMHASSLNALTELAF